MRPLWLSVAQAAGRGRAAIVAACSAGVTALLLVATELLSLGSGYVEADQIASYTSYTSGLVAQPDNRLGLIVAVVLMTVPLLLLLDQAVRLGSAARHRRHVALAVAGATGRDLRRWGAIEVGGPAVAGALIGVPVGLLVREPVLGGVIAPNGAAWWVLVVVSVAGYGVLVGARSGARVGRELSTGVPPSRVPPGWAGLLPLSAGVLLLVDTATAGREIFGAATTAIAVLLVVLGLVLAAPWLASGAAGLVRRRATSADVLLAASRLAADPGPAARAAAAVGAAGVAAGVLPGFVVDVLESSGSGVAFYLGPAAAVAGCIVVVVITVTASLLVHSTETVLERQREMTALVATGVPVSVLSRSQRIEGLLVTLPLATLGGLLGALGFPLLAETSVFGYAAGLGGVLVLLVLVVLTVGGASRVMRPWMGLVVDEGNLRRA